MVPASVRLALFQVLSSYGHSFYEDNEVGTDTTCLLQSYVVPRLSKRKSSTDRLTQLSSIDSKTMELNRNDMLLSSISSKSQELSRNGTQLSLMSSMSQEVAGTSLTSVAISRKSRSGLNPTEGLMGIGIVVAVGIVNLIGVIIAMQLAKEMNSKDFGGLNVFSSDMKLNSALVVPQGTCMSYYIPPTQETKALQAFSILSQKGKQALGVIVNHGADDPGILLHASPSGGGSGATVAFVGPHPDGGGKLRIACPSAEHERGEMFGTLEQDGDAFKVMREGQLLLWIEGGLQNFVMSTGMYGQGEPVGTTSPAGDNYVELRLLSGTDAALAVICYLAVRHLCPSSR